MKNPYSLFSLSLLILPLLAPLVLFPQTVTYTASDQIIGNPERGLQKYSITASNYGINSEANNLSVSMLNSWKNSDDQIRVVFRYFLLEDFINADINSTYLNNMQGDFDNIRTAGFKVIVRFSYSDSQGTSSQQPSKSQILRHIDQIAPLLNTNQDVIFSHQAGFIGTWGEWYYTNSAEFGSEGNISNTQWTNRKEILDAMLATTPAGIPIQVRYTDIKTRLYGSTPLTPQTAYQNTPQARIGFFNDAFLNNWGDQGTYGVNSECQDPVGNTAYNFLSNETQYLPMTGETNGLNPCNNGFRTTGANAVYEMNLTNWTTLNRDYHPDFWSQMIASNHYDEILRRLGYRFVMQSSTLTVNGLDFDITLNLSNQGFARVFKERDVYLVLKKTQDNSITTHLIDTDIRTWENSVSISQNIDPGITGTFQLYLWMPDPEFVLNSNPDYSIRLANENTWQAANGYNDLRQTVSLQCSTTTSTDPKTACGSFTWIDGNTYTSNNNYATFTLSGSNGCDSVITLDLTILNSTSSTDPQTACGSFTWIDGNTYTSNNNSATFTLSGSNGCDSVITLDLTILNSTSSTDPQTACGSFTWIDGNTYTSNNNYATYTLSGSNGCDSVVTLDLTINNVSDITTTTSGATISASNSNASYQWVNCSDGFSPIEGETDRSFAPSINGDYAVILFENGCQDTSACVSLVVTDILNLKLDSPFHIFPNPASNQLFIQNTQKQNGIIEIFDASGKILIKENLNDEMGLIPINQLSRGIFFVRLRTDQQTITQKLLKL